MKLQNRRDFIRGTVALLPVLFVGLLIKRLRKRREGDDSASEAAESNAPKRHECPYCGGDV